MFSGRFEKKFIFFVAKQPCFALMIDDMSLAAREVHPGPSDADCVEASRNGDPDQFRLLVQRYQKPTFAFLMARLRDPLEAEEAAQESFVRAFMSLKSLQKPDSFFCWLLGIAARVAQERFRTGARRERERQAAEVIQGEADSGGDQPPLEEALAALPETYRQVIMLRYYEGLSCQQMAKRLRTPLGTVTKTLSRAYALLRQELAARQATESTINLVHHS